MRKVYTLLSFLVFFAVVISILGIFSTNLSPEDKSALIEGKIIPEVGTKIAFIGDTGIGPDYKNVLTLIQSEEADAVVHLGDFDYTFNPEGFSAVINEKLGENYPYLVVAGNHDRSLWKPNCNSDKGCYSEEFAKRYLLANIPLTQEMLASDKYQFDFQGIQLLFVGPGGVDDGPEFAEFLNTSMSQSNHLWKICNWHFNQEKLQLGGKIDQAGWEIYDTCLNAGAIIATAHEHSYHRTKSLVDFHSGQFPKVNSLYSDPNNLYVYPGSTFVFVSGLGGKSIRNQHRCLPSVYPYGCDGEWAKVYTSNQQAKHGALFIEFNHEGDPTKARGYFKNIDNEIVDTFEITLKVDVAQQTMPPTPSVELTATPMNTSVPTITQVEITTTPVISPTTVGQIPSFTPSSTIVPTATSLLGNTCGKADINGDGVFKIDDFSEFAKSYGTGLNTCIDKNVDYGECGGRDVNRDGKLNIADFGGQGLGFAQRYYPKQSCSIQ